MKHPALLLTLLAASMLSAAALAPVDDTTRPGRLTPTTPAVAITPAAAADTLELVPGDITVSGYDKPLRARREAMFVTNRLGTGISAVELRLVYSDRHSHTLHERTLWVNVIIPAAETRRIDLRSWDTQQSFYYIKGVAPKLVDATPFSVAITPLRAVADP